MTFKNRTDCSLKTEVKMMVTFSRWGRRPVGVPGVLLSIMIFWFWCLHQSLFTLYNSPSCNLKSVHFIYVGYNSIIWFTTKGGRKSEFYPYITDSMCNEAEFMGSARIPTLTEVTQIHLTKITSRIDAYKRNHRNDYKNVTWQWEAAW